MKILFLDIDGVLNNRALIYKHGSNHISNYMAEYIVELLNIFPDLNIVISSCWRKKYDFKMLVEILSTSGMPSERIIGVTPNSKTGSRQEEIYKWLDDTNEDVSNYLVLDDENFDMPDIGQKLIKTDFNIGMNLKAFNEVRSKFLNP